MVREVIEFTVHGKPYPQGSKTAFVSKQTGKAITAESSGANLADWRNAVVDVAIRERSRIPAALTGPLSVMVTFRYKMPQSAPKSDRVHGLRWRDKVPDLDKLCRAIGDALEISNLIASDDLIAEWHARKIEVVDAWQGCAITITRLSMLVDLARPPLSLVAAP